MSLSDISRGMPNFLCILVTLDNRCVCVCEADVSVHRSYSQREFALFLLEIEGGEKDIVLSSCGHVVRDFESEAKIRYNFKF